jgi:hypothetical protein
MISLASYGPGERAEYLVSAPQAFENVAEIDAWPPAQFIPSTTIDVDAIDTRQHSPTALTIRIFVVGE